MWVRITYVDTCSQASLERRCRGKVDIYRAQPPSVTAKVFSEPCPWDCQTSLAKKKAWRSLRVLLGAEETCWSWSISSHSCRPLERVIKINRFLLLLSLPKSLVPVSLHKEDKLSEQTLYFIHVITNSVYICSVVLHWLGNVSVLFHNPYWTVNDEISSRASTKESQPGG